MNHKISRDDYHLLKSYLEYIGLKKECSKEEEKNLIIKGQAGDIHARNMVLENHLKFVIYVARSYQGNGVDLEDLISEGNMGLLHAFDKFKFGCNSSFISYAAWWVKQYIQQAIREKSRLIRLPANQLNDIAKIRKIMNKIESFEEGKEKAIKDLNLSEEKLGMLLNNNKQVSSLDNEVFLGNQNGTLVDLIVSEEDPYVDIERQELNEAFNEALENLTGRDKLIAKYRLGIDNRQKLSLVRLGKILNLSKERVRQLEMQLIDRLRKLSGLNGFHSISA